MTLLLKFSSQFACIAFSLFAVLQIPPINASESQSGKEMLSQSNFQSDSQEGSWNVTDKNTTCIRADLKIEFTIFRQNDKITFFLNPAANSTLSNCAVSNITQLLVLTDPKYTFSILFEKDSVQTYVRSVSLDYKYSIEETGSFHNDSKLFSVHTGNSYLCRSNESIVMGNATMKIINIHLEAFGKEFNQDFSTAEECVADDSVSDLFVISLACGLAALIILVLIAYLVGRRRHRMQRGYQSV